MGEAVFLIAGLEGWSCRGHMDVREMINQAIGPKLTSKGMKCIDNFMDESKSGACMHLPYGMVIVCVSPDSARSEGIYKS